MSKLSPFCIGPCRFSYGDTVCLGQTSATEASRKQSNKTWDELEKEWERSRISLKAGRLMAGTLCLLSTAEKC